jgi:Metallo-peptidase family M12B Reprolysin-like
VREALSFGQAPLSVLAWALQHVQKFVSLNLIYVGGKEEADSVEIGNALYLMSSIYAMVDLSVEDLREYEISADDSHGHEIIEFDAEAFNLWQEWSFPRRAIDVFLVRKFVGPTTGIAPPGRGTCDKAKAANSGVVVELATSPKFTGLTLAHEVGHYLALPHTVDPDNLMYKDLDVGDTKGLTAAQGEVMKRHCMIRSRCR